MGNFCISLNKMTGLNAFFKFSYRFLRSSLLITEIIRIDNIKIDVIEK